MSDGVSGERALFVEVKIAALLARVASSKPDLVAAIAAEGSSLQILNIQLVGVGRVVQLTEQHNVSATYL